MVGRRAGVASLLNNKVLSINSNQQISCIHCIIHQKVLCNKVLKTNHVVDVVVETVDFIRKSGINNSTSYWMKLMHLPYHNEVCWLHRGFVLKRLYELRSAIQAFMLEKGKDVKELKKKVNGFMMDTTEHL